MTGFAGGAVVVNPPANAGDARDVGSIPGLGRSPGVGNGNPLQYILPGKLHGQMNLVGYSSTEGCKESDTTEHAHAHTLKSDKSPYYSVSLGIFLYHVCMFFNERSCRFSLKQS